MVAPCPECKQPLSNTAQTCPHCGYVQKAKVDVAATPSIAPQPAPKPSFLDLKTNAKAALRLSIVVLLLLVVVSILFGPRACRRLVDTATTIGTNVGKTAEEALMRPGVYTVQLEWAELADSDWTKDSFSGKPKIVQVAVKLGDKTIGTTSLGAFRGRKAFTEKPVTFEVPYDGKTDITLKLNEVIMLSDGVKYEVKEPWPFKRVMVGKGSILSFAWK
jgi:hypothetical protein